jgi:hypothetical protein
MNSYISIMVFINCELMSNIKILGSDSLKICVQAKYTDASGYELCSFGNLLIQHEA